MKTADTVSVDSGYLMLAHDLFDNTSSVIYAKDLDFRYLFVNRQFEKLFHVTRMESLGKTDFDVFPEELAEKFRVNDQTVLESGETLQCEEVAPHDDGPHQYFSVKFPLRNESGSIYGIAGISTDVTSQLQTERDLAWLEYRQHLILDSITDGICGLDSAGRIAYLNLAAQRMLDFSTDDLRGECHSKIVLPPKANKPLSHDGEHFPVVAVLNGRSTMNVQDATFRCRSGKNLPVEYTVAPVRQSQTGETVGAVLAFRDSTARLQQQEIEQEIQTALRIQTSLYPKQMPAIQGFDFASYYLPCSKACGDYFDFIPWGINRLGVAVGDVSGHGLASALEMVETRAILRTTMLNEPSPAECLTRLNRILVEDLPEDMFVTLFLACLNTSDRTLTYAAAGHDAIIMSQSGDFRRLKSTGTVLGISVSSGFASSEVVSLNTGDVIVIVTDGLTETLSPERELFGFPRMVDALRRHASCSAREILDSLRVECEMFRGTEPNRDDITAVVIKIV